jgi:hypothetical protein
MPTITQPITDPPQPKSAIHDQNSLFSLSKVVISSHYSFSSEHPTFTQST